jgi:hypothetical protein
MKETISQKDLWDAQHRRRRTEHRDIANVPNEFARKCLGYIPEEAKVLDLGAASGRDPRFFVREKNCEVFALDFYPIALEHLNEDALADGSMEHIIKKFNLRLIELNLSSGQRVDKDSRYVNFIAQKQ